MADESQPKGKEPASAPAPSATSVPEAAVMDDSDPDFDDLDDVLDQFSANAPSSQHVSQSKPTPAASGPGRPETSTADETKPPVSAIPPDSIPEGPKPNESEEEFIARLSEEMSKMMSTLGTEHAAAQSPEEIAKMGKELEDFTHKMEEQGIKPEDLLKAILGEEAGNKLAEAANEEHDRRESEKQESKPAVSPPPAKSSKAGPSSFEDTIRRTMSRLDESDTQAKTATQKSASKSEEDMLAEMLRGLDSQAGGDGGDDTGLSKMFLEMMQQLTHKSMLYEPMKELHTQYPEWLEKNKPPKMKQEDWDRYSRQSVIVKDIVTKFEEPGFKDEDDKCREYIWNKMQDMQSEGAPPEELVKNPFPGSDFGSIPGLGGGGAGGGDEEGCPTQ